MKVTERLRRIETARGSTLPMAALVIPRRPKETREQAAERFFKNHPEHRGSSAPKIYLSLMLGQETSWATAICEGEI